MNDKYAGGDYLLSQAEAEDVTSIIVANKGIYHITGLAYFKNLAYLNCSANFLSSLDVSENTNLFGLDFHGNNLDNINLNQNTGLHILYCQDNNLSTLDVSSNTLLTDLNCANNNLESLDVSANTLLANLGVEGNSLRALDLSNNPNLTQLNRQNNNLFFIGGMLVGIIGDTWQGADQVVTVPVIATGSGGYVSTDAWLPPAASHNLNIFSSSVSYDPLTGLFDTDTLDGASFETLLDGQAYLGGALKFVEMESFTVTFVDWDGALLSTQVIVQGDSAVAPSDPSRTDFAFTGWDKDFSNIQEDLVVWATYKPVPADNNGTTENNGTTDSNGTTEGGGTPVPSKPLGDPKPVPSTGKLVRTSDSNAYHIALATELLIAAGIAFSASVVLIRRKG